MSALGKPRDQWLAGAVGVLLILISAGIIAHRGAPGPADTPYGARALHFEISIPYGDAEFPDTSTFDVLVSVEEELIDALEGLGLAEWEGQSVGAGTYDVGVLGDDERAVLGVVGRVLARHRLAKGTVVEITTNAPRGGLVRTVRL